MLRGIKQKKWMIHPWISKRFRFFYTPQPWTLALIDRINDMPPLHTLKDWWDKSNVTWSLRGQASEKNCQWKKSRLSLFILDNRKWRPFHLKNDLLQPIRSTTQIWVVTRHQYGISALVSLTSFRGLFSEATSASFIILSCARLYLPGKRYWGKPRSCDQHDQTKHWRLPNQPTARPWIRSGSSLSSASYRILSPTESEGEIERKKNTAS